MAVISRDFRTLKKGWLQYGSMMAGFVILGVYIFMSLRGWPRLLTIIPFGGFLFSLRFFAAFSSGLKLEGKITKILNSLSDEYTVIQDITIPGDYLPQKIQHIVVAPRGIFLLETRHRQGRIVSEGEFWHHYWVREHSTFANPVIHAQNKADKLREMLIEGSDTLGIPKDELENMWIQPVVVFTNNKVELKVVAERVPIFKLDEFEKYIQSFKKKVALSIEDRGKLVPYIIGLNLVK